MRVIGCGAAGIPDRSTPAVDAPLDVDRARASTRPSLVRTVDDGSPLPGRAGRSPDRRRRRRRTRQVGGVLVVLKRADRRGVAGLQVVPRPARAEPWSSNACRRRRSARRWRDAGGLSGPPPTRRTRRVALAARADGRVAVAADDEVALGGARYPARRFERGREAMVPAECSAAAASVRIFMFDAGIISLPALWAKSASPRSSDAPARPKAPWAITGASKTVVSWPGGCVRPAALLGRVVAPCRGAACAPQPAATSGTTGASRRDSRSSSLSKKP